MRKPIVFFSLLWIAGVLAWVAAPVNSAPPKPASWYSLTNASDAGGLWVQRDGAKPIGALYASKIGGKDNAVLGFYCDSTKAQAHDFAIIADADGVRFQLRDEKGELVILPTSALAKLADVQPKLARGPPEAIEGIGRGDIGKRLLLKLVKARAVERLTTHGFKDAGKADSKPLSREKAKALVAEVDDEVILKHIVEKYGDEIGEGGKLESLLQWLVDHKEQILQLVKFIVTLLALFADAQTSNIPTGPPPAMEPHQVAYLLAA